MFRHLPLVEYGVEAGRTDCPLCGSAAFSELSGWDRRLKRLRHVRCLGCGLVRQNPLPSEASLAGYYATSYRRDYQGVSSGPTRRHREKSLRAARVRLERLVPLLSGRRSVLDFGCGSGEFVELCGERGLAATGFEPGVGYASHARDARKLDVVRGDWRDVSLPGGGEFEAVTAFHVFEHLVDPLGALERITEWLAPDGLVFIETPNIRNGLEAKGFGSLHFAHTLGFTRPTLEYLGALRGLGVEAAFDEYDIGIVFSRRVPPRPSDSVLEEAKRELAHLSRAMVHGRFWLYTLAKLPGFRLRTGR